MKTIKLFLKFVVFLVISFAVMSSALSAIGAIAEEVETVEFSPEEFSKPGKTAFSVSGLHPNEQVELFIHRPNGEIVTHKSHADAQGVFKGTITVSEELPTGEYRVTIEGMDSGKMWKGTFRVISAVAETTAAEPSTETEPSESGTEFPSDDMVRIKTQLRELSDSIRDIGVSYDSLQKKVDSLENQIKTYKTYPRKLLPPWLVNWIHWWWWIGFIIGWLWFFVWLFFGLQCWKLKFWAFVFPRPWWFFLPLIWFVPWIVWGIVNWLVWWQPWVWVWWIFPWAFWLPWWIIIFKEKEIWLWRKI